MPRGGARVNSGPPPDPNALRRDRPSDKDGWIDLPSQGFDGEIPGFPLRRYVPTVEGGDGAVGFLEDMAVAIAEREATVWGELWRTPQAAAWHRFSWTHEIALYVRCLALGEMGDPKALSEVRQWSDRLGLNPAAMARLRWRIARDQLAERRAETTSKPARRTSSNMRGRLDAIRDAEA